MRPPIEQGMELLIRVGGAAPSAVSAVSDDPPEMAPAFRVSEW